MSTLILTAVAIGFGIYAGFSIHRKEQHVVLHREIQEYLTRAAYIK